MELNNHEQRVLIKLSKRKEKIANMDFKVNGISKHTMKKVLMNLHSKKLIVKTPDLEDMRRVFIKISDDGKDVITF